MEIQEIKGLAPEVLYTQIEVESFCHSIEFGITFRDVLNINPKEKEKCESWCCRFIKCAIDEITTMHKRNNEIAESEKDYFAKNFLRKYKTYTLADIKLFANMVCFCEIGEGLKAVDIGAINEKLVGYNQMRNNYLSDYYAREDRGQSNSQQLISEIDGDPETQFELLKLKLKAYNAIKEEFMQYALDYYRSQGVEVKGVLLPSRIPNYTEAIQEYLELHPNKFWVEYKEARDNKGLLPKGVQSSLQFADIF